MISPVRTRRSPLIYFLLSFAFGIPFWLAGALTSIQLLPALPVSALGFVCMVTAAAILVYRENGSEGVRELLRRSFDLNRAKEKIWYVPTILLMPCIMALSFFVMRRTGTPVPTPRFSVVPTLVLFVAFFIAALGEELGWSGYAIDPLQERFGALWASILLGAVWAAWHFIPLLEAHRTMVFIAWWTLGTVALRVIIVWLYNNTGGSVFVAALFHTMINLSWQLFPINGSFYDPRVAGLITAFVAALVIVVWGPRTFTRRRDAA